MRINITSISGTVAILVIATALSCTIGHQSPTAIPTPTPTPITEREMYSLIERTATRKPSEFDGWLKEEALVRFRGQVTNTEIGKVQFHLHKQSGEFDKYIDCEMRNSADSDRVSIGDMITVRGRLKDAFNEDKRLGSLGGIRNKYVIELKECLILAN